MDHLAGDAVFQWFLSLAHQPLSVYGAVILLLLLSSFGLPVPEEVTLLSAGFIAYIGRSPERYPPPSPDAAVVDPVVLAAVCTIAVLSTDVLVYWLGRQFGLRIRDSKLVGRLVSAKAWERAERWTERHGAKFCWVFRFTPGLRFPGHLTCGMVKLPLWQFCLADGVAVLVSVPTQVLLVAYNGDSILWILKELKVGLAVVLVLLGAAYLVSRLWFRRRPTARQAE